MARPPVEGMVRYADWSDGAGAGLRPSSGEAGLTAAVSEAGGLALYLERPSNGSMLHVELGGDDVRRLYELLHKHVGAPPNGRKAPRRKPRPGAGRKGGAA